MVRIYASDSDANLSFALAPSLDATIDWLVIWKTSNIPIKNIIDDHECFFNIFREFCGYMKLISTILSKVGNY